MDDFSFDVPGFKGDLVTPSQPNYTALLQRWAKNSIRPAMLIACVKDEQDVQLILAYAKDNHIDLAVKCGGHASSEGASSEGIVLDLSKYLNNFDLDVENKTVRVDGGCRFEPVEVAALQQGLMIAAGTVNDTGIGGLTLGGGMGWLSGQHGMMVDNLLAATIVTGTGEIKQVSGDDELFWAIRGGGAGSGVVTSMTYRLHEQRQEIFWGIIEMKPDQLPQVIRVANALKKRASPRQRCTSSFGLWRVQPFYNGTAEEGQEFYKDLLDIPSLSSSAGATRFTNMTTVPSLTSSHNCNCGGVTYTDLTEDMAVALLDKMISIGQDPDFAPTYVTLEYFDKAKVTSVSGDATAYANRGHYQMSAINIRWDGVNDAKMEAQGKEHRMFITALLESGGDTKTYANYDSNHVNREQAMHDSNWPRLKEIKAKYDPDGVFTRK